MSLHLCWWWQIRPPVLSVTDLMSLGCVQNKSAVLWGWPAAGGPGNRGPAAAAQPPAAAASYGCGHQPVRKPVFGSQNVDLYVVTVEHDSFLYLVFQPHSLHSQPTTVFFQCSRHPLGLRQFVDTVCATTQSLQKSPLYEQASIGTNG